MTIRIAGVELGGTKCIAVLGTASGMIEASVEVPTTSPEQTIGRLRATLDEWHRGAGFAAIGIGSFGPLDLATGAIAATAKPGWSGAPILAPLSQGFGVPAFIDTDVTGAALAEGRWGSARDVQSYCYITVGTGVGAGVIVAGQPVRGLGHAEAGHIHVGRVPGDDWAGSCPFHGDCVEGLASGSAIAARTGGKGATLPADDRIWDLVAHTLARLVHTLALVAVPERVIMGGGVITARPHLLPLVRAHLGDSLAGYCAPLEGVEVRERFISGSALGPDVGPLGTLAIALAGLEDGRG